MVIKVNPYVTEGRQRHARHFGTTTDRWRRIQDRNNGIFIFPASQGETKPLTFFDTGVTPGIRITRPDLPPPPGTRWQGDRRHMSKRSAHHIYPQAFLLPLRPLAMTPPHHIMYDICCRYTSPGASAADNLEHKTASGALNQSKIVQARPKKDGVSGDTSYHLSSH